MNRLWSTQELELFHDGELAPQQHEELVQALRGDASLRDRLARLQHLDRRVTAVLRTSRAARRRPAPTVIRFSAFLAAAALLTLAAGLWHFFPADNRRLMDTARRSPELAPLAPTSPVAIDTPVYDAVRVAFSLPPRPRNPLPAREPTRLSARRPAKAATAAPLSSALRESLARQDADAALAILAAASDAERTESIEQLATLLRSAATVERLLERLPEQTQVELCAAMARDGRFRPAAFSRLRRLAGDARARPLVAETLRALEQDRDLRDQLRAYRMTDLMSPGT